MKIAAQLAGTSYDELVALNPGYNRWATDPDGPHRMLVPIDNADAFDAALKTLGPDDRVRFASHEVTRKDTLAMIAKQYGTSVAVITKINDLKGGKVTAGETLKIPEISGAVARQGVARRRARGSAGNGLSAAAGSARSSIGCARARP